MLFHLCFVVVTFTFEGDLKCVIICIYVNEFPGIPYFLEIVIEIIRHCCRLCNQMLCITKDNYYNHYKVVDRLINYSTNNNARWH